MTRGASHAWALVVLSAIACDGSDLVIPPYDARISQATTPWAVECNDGPDTSNVDAELGGSCACWTSETGDALGITHGPVLGAITDRSVKIWVRSSGEGELSVRIWPTAQPDAVRCTRPVRVVRELDHTAVAILDGLRPATSYSYQIAYRTDDAERPVASAVHWTFRTLPQAGRPARVRFVVGADVRGEDVPGFAGMQAADPDFVLMIGDNVYADDNGYDPEDYGASFARYQSLYQTVWGGRQFRDLFSSTPSFMIWDDHEIMENYWAGKSDLLYAVARRLYDSYQHSHNPRPLQQGELYYAFSVADIGFFVLDTRSHRDGNMDDDDVNKTMLGAAQRQAFEEWLADKSHRVHVIVSSVIFSDFATTGADPWRSFSVERAALLDALADNATPNTFIVSGDQHWSAVLKLTHGELDPYSLFEFQTTPLGSGVRAVPRAVGADMTALDNTHRVFGVFDVDTRVDPPALDFTLCAVGRRCEAHMEPAPESIDAHTATVPYSLFFEGSANGFVMLPGPQL